MTPELVHAIGQVLTVNARWPRAPPGAALARAPASPSLPPAGTQAEVCHGGTWIPAVVAVPAHVDPEEQRVAACIVVGPAYWYGVGDWREKGGCAETPNSSE